MFTKPRYHVFSWLLTVVLAVAGVYFPTASANDSFAGKVATLREELRGYDAIKRPDIRYKACVRIHNALLTVLQEKESLAAEPRDIIGDSGGFTLRFDDWANMDGKKYRLVVFTPKDVNMGATTAVFSQVKDGVAVNMVEQVHSLTQGAIVGCLEYSAITASDDGYYLMLIEKRFGPEDKSMSFYTQRLESGRWQPAMSSPDVATQGHWSIDKHSKGTGFSISHAVMYWKSPYTYRVNTANGYFTIEIVDKDASPLDSIRLEFVAGKWVVK